MTKSKCWITCELIIYPETNCWLLAREWLSRQGFTKEHLDLGKKWGAYLRRGCKRWHQGCNSSHQRSKVPWARSSLETLGWGSWGKVAANHRTTHCCKGRAIESCTESPYWCPQAQQWLGWWIQEAPCTATPSKSWWSWLSQPYQCQSRARKDAAQASRMGLEWCLQHWWDQLLLEVHPKQWFVDQRVAWEEIGQNENVSIGYDECHRYQKGLLAVRGYDECHRYRKDLLAVHSDCKKTTVLWEEGGVRSGPLVLLQQEGMDDGRGVCQCIRRAWCKNEADEPEDPPTPRQLQRTQMVWREGHKHQGSVLQSQSHTLRPTSRCWHHPLLEGNLPKAYALSFIGPWRCRRRRYLHH